MMTIDDDLFGKSREEKNEQKHEESRQDTAQQKWRIRRIDSKRLKILQKTDPGIKLMQIIQLIVEHSSTREIVYCADIGCHLVEMVKTWL